MSATAYKQYPSCASVYGPVESWRFGRSLGIDPIGSQSTCSFHCIYCQLGKIEAITTERQIFVPTTQIIDELQTVPLDNVDTVTLSGSGEPTLALNLEKIIGVVKRITKKPTVVLTNSTLLSDPQVRRDLIMADTVAAKLDAVSSNQLQQVNRCVETINLPSLVAGIEQFRQEYSGHLAIQTMVLSPWTPERIMDYIQILHILQPDEVQLNIPARPRVLVRQLDARGNDILQPAPYLVQNLRCISTNVLASLANQIHNALKIPVRYPGMAVLV
ncbi:radical SAM domain-containing protein [Tolypothrix tenuis PCC 7101]|uniref:Radical SAM domain-containing protein n=1 Tax=Tolypothrix tenuis PCC 7101 TaxID=231146 RepID=A0A1Z4N1W5_9CYAN|nr:radical SAM protein [Aulosira sp. FACHB-113]BAY99706.1 radical SAM domain-containing protein [Tolypothrix tenuis PCC 7101]BAZ76372.1 radical SAM domain-containing protein [Aulosira laxa NIES-50]